MYLNIAKKTIATVAILAGTMATSYAATYDAAEPTNNDGAYAHILGGASIPTASGLKTGYNAGVALGYKKGSWRYEAELLHSQSKLKFDLREITEEIKEKELADQLLDSLDLSGKIKVTSALANIYHDFENLDLGPVTPYVGLGIGVAHINGKVKVEVAAFNESASESVSGNEFAYQGIAGLRYDFNDKFAFTTDYRFVGTEGLRSHTINAGIVARFS